MKIPTASDLTDIMLISPDNFILKFSQFGLSGPQKTGLTDSFNPPLRNNTHVKNGFHSGKRRKCKSPLPFIQNDNDFSTFIYSMNFPFDSKIQ